MNQMKNEEGENINVNTSSEQENDQNGRGFSEIATEEIQNKKIKNLISTIIVLAGIIFGSLFVDVAQFLTQSGYSERALENAEIFSAGGKTWVSFDDPTVEVRVLAVDKDELEDCPACDPSEVLYQLKKVIPTLVAKEVSAFSDEGKKMIKEYGLNAVPSFVFAKDITKTSFYAQSGVSSVFEEKENNFILNSNVLGIPAGKYLTMPQLDENDAVLGNKDADVKIIIFSDYQCPYSKMFYDIARKVLAGYSDNTAFVLRNLPLNFHPQAQNAAMTSSCAQEQGKFWEMADLLYKKQEEWGEATGKDIFKKYGIQIGLNTVQFNQCLDEDKYLEEIQNDQKLAEEFGISGTPSGFIGDQFMGGVLQEEQFKSAIEAQLAK